MASEGIPGAFSSLYPVLARLEETGRVRRGYFVEGLGGAQFALPGAVDRLRTDGGDEAVLLAATDPANPYGAALPWPEVPTVDRRGPRERTSLSLVADPMLFVERGGKRVLAFTDDAQTTRARRPPGWRDRSAAREAHGRDDQWRAGQQNAPGIDAGRIRVRAGPQGARVSTRDDLHLTCRHARGRHHLPGGPAGPHGASRDRRSSVWTVPTPVSELRPDDSSAPRWSP